MIAVFDTVIDAVSAALILSGSSLALVAAVGLLRLGDARSRMHAATKPATLGVVMCGTGAILQFGDGSSISKTIVIVALQLITAPIGAHALSHAITRRRER